MVGLSPLSRGDEKSRSSGAFCVAEAAHGTSPRHGHRAAPIAVIDLRLLWDSGLALLLLLMTQASGMRKNAQIQQRLAFQRHPVDVRHEAGHVDIYRFQ